MKTFSSLFDYFHTWLGVKRSSYNLAKSSIRHKEENIVLWGISVRIYGVDEMRVLFGYDQTESALVAIENEIEKHMAKESFNFYVDDRSNLMFFGNHVETALDAESRIRNSSEIISEIVNKSMLIGNKKVHLKVGIGGLIWRGAENDSEGIMARLYGNMMEAVNSGERLIMNQYAGRNVYRGFDVQDLIDTNGLTIALQPIINNVTGKTLFVEAFLRVNDGTRRYAGALDAVNSACDVGVSIQLDETVLRMACREQRRWHEYKTIPEFISINVSKQTLLIENAAERLRMVADHEGVSTTNIAIEINGAAITKKSLDDWKQIVKALKLEGFKVIVDDFDKCEITGPEILGLDIDIIKIDRGLTKSLSESIKLFEYVKSLNTMCEKVGIGFVAEGVEEIVDAEILRKAGDMLLQGTGLFRPADTLILDRFLNK